MNYENQAEVLDNLRSKSVRESVSINIIIIFLANLGLEIFYLSFTNVSLRFTSIRSFSSLVSSTNSLPLLRASCKFL